LDLLARLEPPDRPGLLGLVDQQVHMERLALLAQLAIRAPLVHKVNPVLPVCLALQDPEDL